MSQSDKRVPVLEEKGDRNVYVLDSHLLCQRWMRCRLKQKERNFLFFYIIRHLLSYKQDAQDIFEHFTIFGVIFQTIEKIGFGCYNDKKV